MNDCIHFSETTDECAIYGVPCDSISREVKGCYMSIAERDLILYESQQKGGES
jgi:hypothetical protein